MKANLLKPLTVVMLGVLSFALWVLPGCTLGAKDLIHEGSVRLETVPSRHAKFAHIHVYQSGPDMTLFGALYQRHQVSVPSRLHGHIDVQVLDPDGALLQEVPTRIHRKDKRWHRAWFRLPISESLPEGSTLRLRHHAHSFNVHHRTCECL